MEQTHERRQYGRLNLLAYGQGKTCTLELGGVRCQCDLIDISAGGARVKHQPPPALPGDKELVFTVDKIDDGGLLQRLPATVRWRNGSELGIQFDTSLEVAIVTLQKLVC